MVSLDLDARSILTANIEMELRREARENVLRKVIKWLRGLMSLTIPCLFALIDHGLGTLLLLHHSPPSLPSEL